MNDEPAVRPLPDPRYAALATGEADVQAPRVAGEALAPRPTAGGFVYAVGRLQARFPTLGVEREYAQVADTPPEAPVRSGQLKDVLSAPEHRYLARQLCWVFKGPAGDACTVIPREDNDLAELIDLLAPEEEQVVQALVGSPAASVSPTPCLAAGLPAAWPEQVLSFTMDEFTEALPRGEHGEGPTEGDGLRSAAEYVFAQLTQRADNRGLTDEHRALNYLALRYPAIYHLAAQAMGEGKTLIGVDAHPVQSGDRRVVAVRPVFRHAKTHVVERYYCPVDVTDLFPLLTGALTQTYD
jgi:PatG C-terminal